MLRYSRLFVNHLKALESYPAPCKTDYLSQQTRNTFILKRRYPVGLYKKNHFPHKFKPKNFIYNLVEDTNTKPKELLDLILTEYVTGYGNIGTRILIKSDKAYETLLLPKLADYASPENIAKFAQKTIDEQGKAFSSNTVEMTMKFLSKKRISVIMSKDVPWVLEKWHVRANFRKIGIYMPEDVITMPEKPISGPNLDIEGKEFYVTITINNCEQVKVRCCIHHWASEKAARIYVEEEFWKHPAEPIFPEDKPILDSLPPFWVEKEKKT